MILTSKEFTTQVSCKKEMKDLKTEIYQKMNADPKTTVLPHGLIILEGYNKEVDGWVSITDVIGRYGMYIGSKYYTKFRLITVNLVMQK